MHLSGAQRDLPFYEYGIFCNEDVALPVELALEVFSKLDIRSLLQCELVSANWSVLANDNSLWKKHCLNLQQSVVNNYETDSPFHHEWEDFISNIDPIVGQVFSDNNNRYKNIVPFAVSIVRFWKFYQEGVLLYKDVLGEPSKDNPRGEIIRQIFCSEASLSLTISERKFIIFYLNSKKTEESENWLHTAITTDYRTKKLGETELIEQLITENPQLLSERCMFAEYSNKALTAVLLSVKIGSSVRLVNYLMQATKMHVVLTENDKEEIIYHLGKITHFENSDGTPGTKSNLKRKAEDMFKQDTTPRRAVRKLFIPDEEGNEKTNTK